MKTDKYTPMKKSQWHLLFWSCLALAVFMHVYFCEWTREGIAHGKQLRSVVTIRSSEGQRLGGVYTDRPDIGFTAAFLCGLLVPAGLVIAAGMLLLDRPRPKFPPLAKYLEDLKTGDDPARAEAARALANIGPRGVEAVPSLARALRDENLEVRLEAAKALAIIGPEAREAVPDLILGLEDRAGRVRERCARALGKIGHDAEVAIPALEGLLKDENELVRLYAMEALERIRGDRATTMDSGIF